MGRELQAGDSGWSSHHAQDTGGRIEAASQCSAPAEPEMLVKLPLWVVGVNSWNVSPTTNGVASEVMLVMLKTPP